jgi:hypothetical protein
MRELSDDEVFGSTKELSDADVFGPAKSGGGIMDAVLGLFRGGKTPSPGFQLPPVQDPMGINRPAQAAPAFESVLNDAQPDPSKFNFKEASIIRRMLDDNQERRDQYGTIGPIVGPEVSAGSVAKGLLTDLVAGGKGARAGVNQMVGDLIGSERLQEKARKERGQADLMSAVNTPEIESATGRGIYGGLSSLVRNAPSLALAAATRSPAVALGGMAAPMLPEEYGKFRQRGGTPLESLAGAAGNTATEVATEMLPMGFLVKQFGRAGAGQFLTGLLAREVPGEQVATLVQDAIDTAVANPDKTWGDYIKERPGAAYQTLIATLTQGGIMGAGNAAVNRLNQSAQPSPQDVIARVMGQQAPAAPLPATAPTPPAAPADQNALADRIVAAITGQQAELSDADVFGPAPNIEAPNIPDVSQIAPELNTSQQRVENQPQIEQVAPDVTLMNEGNIAAPITSETGNPAAPAPVQAPAITPETAAPVLQPATSGMPEAGAGATQPPQAAPQPNDRYGVDSTPFSQGGKPFKTKLAAQKAKKLQPMMRVVSVPGGFALADKTPAQLAAEAKAAKRIRGMSTGNNAPMAVHEFIAAEGGLSRSVQSDLGIEGNVKIGNRWLYAGPGKGMTIEQAAEKLKEAGYIDDELHNTAYDIIRRSINEPQYTPEGWEQVAEAEREAQFEDYLAAQQDEPTDPFAPLTAEELAETGYNQYNEETQAEIRALVEQAEALGIDADAIKEDLARAMTQATQQDYENAAKAALQKAIEGSNGSRSQDSGQEGTEAGATEQAQAESLTSYTPQEIEDRLAKLEQAEQQRQQQDREAEQRAQADAQRDDFTLTGSNRDADVAAARGQQDIFSAAPDETEDAPASPTGKIEDLGEKIGGARKDTATSTGRSAKPKTNDERPAWARRFQVSQIAAGDSEGRWVMRDTRSKDWMGQPKQVGGSRNTYATEQEALDAVPLAAVSMKHRAVPTGTKGEDGEYSYEIWRDINDRKRVKVVDQVFPSRVAAMEYMAKNAQAILETNTTFGEADLPRPDNTNRTGVMRRDGDVEGKDFMEAFGFRGVEFGNWNNQAERQEVMNAAYDGLMDLAEVMGIPSKAIGLNGDLALAFGARGQGLNSAVAHYERSRAVINLTKMNGAGALAHEWLHALDHYLGRQDGKTSAEWKVNADGTRTFDVQGAENDMASGGFKRVNSGVRQELRDAYKNVMETMFTKAEQYVEDTAKADKFVAKSREDVAKALDSLRKDLSEQKDVRYYKRNNKPASAEQLAEFDTVAKQVMDGEALELGLVKVEGSKSAMGSRWSNEALEKLSAIYKAVRGRTGFDSTNQSGVMDRLRGDMTRYSQRLKMLADAQAGDEKTKRVPTEFAMNAKELDQGRGENYWTTPHEMAARAFQGYVEDKIAAQGARSPFLNYAPENVGILTPWGAKRPYPYGQERKAINEAFDKFVGVLETRETDKGVALYSQSGRSVGLPLSLRASELTIEDELEKRLEGLAHRPEVLVLDSAVGTLPGASDEDGISGANWDGRIYLFRDQLSNRLDVQHTLFHELLHYGLRRFLTKDQFIAQMKKLYDRDTYIKQEADDWVKTKKGQQTVAESGQEYAKARGVDEALATLAEPNQGKYLKTDLLSRAQVTVTRWLAQLAEALGFKQYAAKIRSYKNEEARQLIQEIFTKLREDAAPARNAWTDAADPAFKSGKSNRDAMGRVKFRLGEVALGKLDAVTRPLQERFGMRMASPELRRQLRTMKATIDQANRSAANVAQQMKDMPEADRAMVSDIVEKMIAPGVVPPEHAVRVADAITKTMDRQTDELVALGMLSQDSADRWRGRYLPRIYNRKTELGEDTAMDAVKNMFKTGRPTMQGIGGGSLKGRGLFQDVSVDAVDQWLGMGYEVRDPHWKLNQGKLELVDKNAPQAAKDQVTVWRDWTPSERAQMGENRDALFRYVQGYTNMQRDIALGRLFNQIANNPDFVRRSASEGWVKVPDTEIPDTGGVKRYGNLAGLYVRQDVMSHLSRFEESANEALQLWRDALGLWKEGKTALNPVAHFNNIASNISMAHFAGVSYWDGHKYVGAARDLVNDVPMVEEAREAGLFTGSFTKEELMQNMPPELQKMMQMEDSKLQKAGRQVMNALTFWLRKPLQNAYEFEDTYFKYLIYRDARLQGLSPEDATDYALKYIFTYDDLPSGARKVRDFAIPFFSWTYKALPALLHTAMVYPWRFLAPAAMLNGINLVAYALAAGDDDDDWLEKIAKGRELEKEEREALPERSRGTGMLLNPKTIRLGTDSVTGNPVFLDASRVVPGGDMFDMENQAGGLPIPAPFMPNHPILSAFSAMIANKELFMGREVVDKNDTGLEAAEKRAKWMAGFMLPAVAPGGYHSQRILDATANAMDTVIKTPLGEFTGVDRSGLPVQPKYAAMQTLGIKARPVDLELEASRRKAQESALVNSIAAEVRSMSRLYQKGAVSDDMMDRTREKAREKIERMREKE